jgi:hypothetical protein
MLKTTQWIADYGAIGDGKTLCTQAIQHALNAAEALGGGTVVIPPGTYLIGTLHLRNHVTLDIQPGATLLGSPDIADYPPMTWGHNGDRQPHHLIVAEGLEGVAIRGGGVIDGNGPAFWKPIETPRTWIGALAQRVSPMLEIVNCRDVRLSDITLTNSPGWTCHLTACDGVAVRGVVIENYLFGPNTDGFDINGCADVTISDCRISTGDDAIVLKTTSDVGRPCERIAVTNCIIRTNCVGLKLGTESAFDMRQIVFSNCVVYQSTRAIGLYCLDGATFEDIAVHNIVCDTEAGFPLNRPVHIDLRRRTDETPMGVIRNVVIGNLVARGDGRILMTAEDGGRLEHIALHNIQLSQIRWDDPDPKGATAGSAQFSNRSPKARVARAAVVADNIDGLTVRDLSVTWPADPGPSFAVLWGRNLRGGVLDCPMAGPTGDAPKYALADSEIAVRG